MNRWVFAELHQLPKVCWSIRLEWVGRLVAEAKKRAVFPVEQTYHFCISIKKQRITLQSLLVLPKPEKPVFELLFHLF